MEIELKLTLDEVNFILQTMGELPTKTGVWPLIVKIKEQADPQVPKPTEQ
jgi:hypothetical protein